MLWVNTMWAGTQPAAADQETISFRSGNYLLKGWLMKPHDKSGALPVIVMAPGFAGVKECNYQFIAQHFVKEGFAVLLFDYPNFGESEGDMRQEADPNLQAEAYRDAVTFVSARADIDRQRIGLWGGSYSGGHVLKVAASEARVKAVVALTPFISGGYLFANLPQGARDFLQQSFQQDRLARQSGKPAAMVPVVSNQPNAFSAVPGGNAFAFVESFKSYAPNFKNQVTLKSLGMQFEYEPAAQVEYIQSPVLVIIAKADELMPEAQIKGAYDRMKCVKKLSYMEGHHFSPYTDQREEMCRLSAEWFKEQMK